MPRPVVNGTTREANRVRDRKQDYPRSEKNCAFIRACIVDTATPRNDHYRAIFGCKATNGTVSNMASRTWNAPAMKEYAEELRAELRERFMVTVESLIEELHEIKLVALDQATPQCGAAVAAVLGKAKLAGLDKAIEKEASDATPVRVIIQVEDASHRESK